MFYTLLSSCSLPPLSGVHPASVLIFHCHWRRPQQISWMLDIRHRSLWTKAKVTAGCSSSFPEVLWKKVLPPCLPHLRKVAHTSSLCCLTTHCSLRASLQFFWPGGESGRRRRTQEETWTHVTAFIGEPSRPRVPPHSPARKSPAYE